MIFRFEEDTKLFVASVDYPGLSLLDVRGGVMRTRRSPRNQERLWQALGGPKKPKAKKSRLPSRAEARARLFPKEDEAEMRDRFNHGMMTKEEEEEALKSLEE